MTDISDQAATAPGRIEDRPTRPALIRGLRCRCPNCGVGPLFDGYLTVRDRCDNCNEVLSHHRADDGPAYLTILIVGHLLAPFMHVVFTQFRPSPWVFSAGFITAAVVLSLYLLPRMKGAVVGIQWARRMHGFGGAA